jgi:hypothetical protein
MKRKYFRHLRHKNRNRYCRRKNRHHLLNKCRGGSRCDENMLWMDIEKHNLLHRIFRNDDPEYIMLVLDRMMDMKGYRRFRGVRLVRNQLHEVAA